MQPAGALPGKNEPIVRGPEKLPLRDNVMENAARTVCRAKDLVCGASFHVNHADGERLAFSHGTRAKKRTHCGDTQKSDLAAVRRPDGASIAIDARIQIAEII